MTNYEVLKKLMELTDDIINVAKDRTRHEHSMKQMGIKAHKSLKQISERINDLNQ